MRNHKVAFIAIALIVGCGGESTSSKKATTPSADVARTAGGEAITTADGNAVSKKAHGKWESALDEFQANEKSGWTSAKCSASEKSFERAADAQGGSFAEAHYMAGLALSRCGDSGAYKHYDEALKVDSKFCKARAGLGLRDLQSGRTAQAKSAFERAIKDDPQCTSGYTNLAIVQRAQGQSEEALKNLRRALAIESDYLSAFNQMALLHYDRGRKGNAAELDLAEVVCRQAQMLDADYAPIYNTWGLIKVYKGDVISALRFFQRAITLDPDLFEAQMNFGEVTISFRGYEDGRKAFARAVELDPDNYDAVIGLGTALRGLERFSEAETQYERAKQLDGKRAEAYFNLGVLYQDYMSGSVTDLKKAKLYFTEFLKRAGKQTEFRSSVQDVSNRCAQKSGKKSGAPKCRPGRMQNINISVDAMQVTG
ncbi:MAG: tetratricopeptide repeat protein [Deltaproteobacteria bacterium]|nr:tetratricopeptide repeat protein [Deltaproteobacteria bacterium]